MAIVGCCGGPSLGVLVSRMMIVKTGEFESKTNLYSNKFVVEVFMVFSFSQNLVVGSS